MTQPFRKGAPFGKLLCLSLEVEHMDSLAINDRTASDASTRAGHSKADFLRKWTPVGGRTKLVPVTLKNGHVISSAEARGTLDDDIKHGLELGRRGADDPQNLGRRRLLLERVGKPLFQLDTRFTGRVNSRSRLRSGGTTLATVRSVLRAFARRGHLNRPHAEEPAFRG